MKRLVKKVNFTDLIKNEMYYIKDNTKHHEFRVGSYIFIEHRGEQYLSAYCKVPFSNYTCYLSRKYNYFKVVTQEEYYKKVKEKYDQTCLDIILKHLVNEHFCW